MTPGAFRAEDYPGGRWGIRVGLAVYALPIYAALSFAVARSLTRRGRR